MRLMISPNQSFKVRRQAQLSYLQNQSLTQLYQPIMGGQALSLYLTLSSLPMADGLWSDRTLHAQLLETLNTGINSVDEARLRLEGIGLLRTYRDSKSHSQAHLQSLVYDLLLPLDAYDFFAHPQLSISLYQAIGDQEYQARLRHWQLAEIDKDVFVEMTSDFSSIYHYLSQPDVNLADLSPQGLQLCHQDGQAQFDQGETDFSYSRFLELVIEEGIDHSDLTQVLKDHVLTCHQLFGLDEYTMAEVIKLAIHPIRHHVQLDRIKQIAQHRSVKDLGRQQRDRMALKAERQGQAQNQIKDQNQAETDSVKHSQFSPDEIQLLELAEKVNSQAFLYNLKKQKHGFATDAEYFYLRDLANKTDLTQPVINILLYYLLVIQKRDNIFKGELEKTANQWQQAQIKTASQALDFIHKEDKDKQVRDKKASQSLGAWKPYRSGRSSHQEVIPAWMKNKQKEESNASQGQADSPIPRSGQHENFRDRLNRIMGREVDR